MNDPYVAANMPMIRELAAMLDWALVGHVFLAGVIVFLAWRVAQLRARVSELEETLAQAQHERPKASEGTTNVLGPASDDRQIPPIRFVSDATSRESS